MTLADIIDRVRTNTHDKDVLEYEDTTITDYINDGIRFVRRTILSIDALQLLDDIVTGTLPAGEAIIQQDMRSSAVLEVRINGKRIDRISPWGIYDTRERGMPQGYFVTGFGKINVWPVSSEDVEYSIMAIRDMVLLRNLDDEFPMMNELVDFVVEYACIRASMTNEFDLSQETSVMGSVVSQIEDLIRKYNSRGIQAGGYWDTAETAICDYGRRRYR